MKYILGLFLTIFCINSNASEITVRSDDGVIRTLTATRAYVLRDRVELSNEQGDTVAVDIFWLKAMNIDTLNFAKEAVRNKAMRITCNTDGKSKMCMNLDIVVNSAPE